MVSFQAALRTISAARSTMELGVDIRVVQDPLSEQRNVWGNTLPTVEQAWQLLQVNR